MTRIEKAACLLILSVVPNLAFAGLLGVNSDDGNLFSVSETTAALTLIGNTGIGGWADIAFAPNGTLYGFTQGSTPILYTINPNTAAVTPIGPLTLPFVFEGGLAFAPNGTAYGTNGDTELNPQLFTLNLQNGHATVIGTISGGSHDIDGLAYRTSDGKLIGLDRVTNSLLVIDPTTAASITLAALAPTVGGVGGLTIFNGVGYFDTAGPGGTTPGSNQLFSFNISTGGSATLIGSLGPTITGTGMSGLAATALAAAVPEPATFALAGAALVMLFYRNRKRALRGNF